MTIDSQQNPYIELAQKITENQKRFHRRTKIRRYSGWLIKAGLTAGIVTLMVI